MRRRVGRSVGLAAVCAASVIASFVAGKAARDAILLSSFDVTSLPLFVGIAAALSIPLVLVIGRLMVRFGPARLMTVLNALSAALLVGEWIVFQSVPDIAAVITFFHLSSFGAVLVSGFWSAVNERFDPQTAKRHIGQIGMAATLGGIVGGLVAERSAVYLAPGMILLVIASLQAICAVLGHLLGSGSAAPAVDHERAGWSALRHVSRSSLLRNLALVLTLDAIAATTLDYVFKAEVTAATGPDDTLRLFAIFYTASSVLTAIVQLTAARFVIEKLGVTRGIATLPMALTLLGVGVLAAPGLAAATLARGGELVTRSTIYRVGYELVYAPLLEHQKRSTKIVLDVGVERIGDLLGAQLVALLIFAAPSPGPWLAGTVIAAGALAFVFAMRLPRGYTSELERSLRTRAPDLRSEVSPSLVTWPTLTETGDLTAMSLLDLRAMTDPLAIGERVTALRSGEPERIRLALVAPLAPELAAIVIPLLGRDETAGPASKALRAVARRCTGAIVDALLDPAEDVAVRRRLPAIVEVGEPALAAWGLWRGLADPVLEVRYRCGRALVRIGANDHTPAAVFALVKRELAVDHSVWRTHRLVDDDESDDESDDDATVHAIMRRRSPAGLEHIFTLLALVIPPDPLRIAHHALQTDDDTLRGTALEYLESVLPADVRAALWPLIDLEPPKPPKPGSSLSSEHLASRLQLSRAQILAKVAEVAKSRPETIDWEANKEAMRVQKASLRRLFEASAAASPQLAGRYVLRLVIAPTGTIVNAEVIQHPAGDGVEGFAAALVAEARSWRFVGARTEVTISYPFVFETAAQM